MKIEDKIIPEEIIAVISHKGSLKDVEILLAKLSGWIESNNIKTGGFPFMIFYKLPNNVAEDEVVYDLGVPIIDEAEKTELINIATMVEHRVLSCIHIGSYDTIQKDYNDMVEYAVKNNYDIIGSPKEIYIKSIYDVPEEEMITEIQFPVIKM